MTALIATVAGCAYPSFYSHRFKGQVVDNKNLPLADASIVNVVWKHCTGIGKPTKGIIRQESLRTDKNGRYSIRLRGSHKFEFPLESCLSHSYETYICKFGYAPKVVEKPGKKIVLGEAGEHQGGFTYIDYPHECRKGP